MGSRQLKTTDGLWWMGGAWSKDPDPPKPDPDPEPDPKGSVRGLHGSAGTGAPPRHLWDYWISELKAMGIKWYKQLDSGDPGDTGDTSTYQWVKALKAAGIEPIIRYYVHRQFPKGLPYQAFDKMGYYAAAGVVYAELGNEPNLPNEWETEHQDHLSWRVPAYPADLANTWIEDATRAINVGARPGFYALAPTDWGAGRPHPTLSSVMFYDKIFGHINADPELRSRMIDYFNGGYAWLAVHNSPYEFSLDFDPWIAPPWDMCIRGHEIPIEMLRLVFGLEDIETISTEGGLFCMDSSSMGGHQRLGSHQEHAVKTVQTYDYVYRETPLRGLCSWLICNEYGMIGHHDDLWSGDGWYRDGYTLPVVREMKETRGDS